jgi:LPXTG-site transpeptidase (sortase) family protein
MNLNLGPILKEKIKRLWKPFFVFFLISFLIFNWTKVSWLFNYQVISQFFSGFSEKEINEVDFNKRQESLNLEDFEYTEKENGIEIPKLKIEAPLIFPDSSDNGLLHDALDRGVVHFPESSLPGEKGRTEILGHSAPEGWPKIKYDWVFTNIVELEKEDQIFVYFNNRKYVYEVKETIFLERGESIPNYPLTNSENMLVLISCWPPGKDLRRIAIISELI